MAHREVFITLQTEGFPHHPISFTNSWQHLLRFRTWADKSRIYICHHCWMGCFPTCQHSQVEQCWSDHPASNSSSSCLTSESISGLKKARFKCLLKATRRARSSARTRSAMSITLKKQGLNNASSEVIILTNSAKKCLSMHWQTGASLLSPFNISLTIVCSLATPAMSIMRRAMRNRYAMQKRCHPPANIWRCFTRLVVNTFKTNINKMVYQVRLIQLPSVKVEHPEKKTSQRSDVRSIWINLNEPTQSAYGCCSQGGWTRGCFQFLRETNASSPTLGTILKLLNSCLWDLVKALHNWMHLLFRGQCWQRVDVHQLEQMEYPSLRTCEEARNRSDIEHSHFIHWEKV